MPGHRGRRSLDEQLESVIPLIRAEIWILKDQRAFADAIGVKALATLLIGELWPLGASLHLLIAGAVLDVAEMAAISHTRAATRMAAFLRLWHGEHLAVTATARQLGVSRSHVAKTIQPSSWWLSVSWHSPSAHRIPSASQRAWSGRCSVSTSVRVLQTQGSV